MTRANERGPFFFFSFASEISSPERAPSPLKANERVLFAQFPSRPWQKSALAYLPSPVRANERGLFVEFFLPCHGQKSAPRRGPLICVNGEGKWAGSLCSVFTVPRAEISSPRLAHLVSPVRANERGAFVQFLPRLGQKAALRRGPLICPQWRGQMSGVRLVSFYCATGRKSARRRGPLIGSHR